MKEDDDLKGFVDLFEDTKKNPQKKKEQTAGLEILNFLMEDQRRLNRINQLFEHKISSNLSLEHMTAFLEKQIEENRLHRFDLSLMLGNIDSFFIKECSSLVNFHFKQIKNPS